MSLGSAEQATETGIVHGGASGVCHLCPLAHVTRGDVVESIHFGDIAVCDTSGTVIGAVGDPTRCLYWRSSAKPIQALVVVQSGAVERFGLSQKEIAICCGSHSGSAEHVETVRGILRKVGLDEGALQCGIHWPSDTEEHNRLVRAGQRPSPLHNNCSGKHAGMLAATAAMGADPATYLNLDHPLQQAIIRNMSVLCDVPGEAMLMGVDGCGVPTHALSLRAMATGFARLCQPQELPCEVRMAAEVITGAMVAEPVMVSARGSFNTELLAAGQGRYVGKGGAEGLFVLGLPERGLGIAVRFVDGSHRATAPVVLRVLELLGALDGEAAAALARFAPETVVNCHGTQVGEIRAAEFGL